MANYTYTSIEDAQIPDDAVTMHYCGDCKAWTPHRMADDGAYECTREHSEIEGQEGDNGQ